MGIDSKWLTYATEDLEVAKLSLERYIYNQVCFHSQQAVEKILKGFLELHDKEVPRTHSLRELLRLSIRVKSELGMFFDYAIILDQYYIPTRYPDAVPGVMEDGLPDQEDAREALNMAKEILEYLIV